MPSLLLLLLSCDPAPSPSTPAAPAAATTAARIANSVHITSPYARAMPAGSPTSAVFMQLHNGGETDTALVSARSSVAETAELHTHTEVDGLMQMRPVPRIDLPAGQQVLLQPGGLHVMLIGLQQALTAGSAIDLVLVYEDGSEAQLQVPVLEIMPTMESTTPGAGAASGMDHSEHGSPTPTTDG